MKTKILPFNKFKGLMATVTVCRHQYLQFPNPKIVYGSWYARIYVKGYESINIGDFNSNPTPEQLLNRAKQYAPSLKKIDVKDATS